MLRICLYIRNTMRIIRVLLKNGTEKFYSSLDVALSWLPGHKRATVDYHLQRKKKPYKTDELTLTRINVTNKKK